ncbi:MAG: HipA domain-containing protein [Treponema sp.]|nr:HipA domain-containing protein [Treponema sp.]MCL2272310.1 HipA domain-containing protein [Treponema sp.]
MDKEYILKHKNVPVLLFKLNEDYELSEFGAVFDEKRLPFGVKYSGKKEAQFKQLADWIENRGLPRGRSDLTNIQQDMDVKSSVELSFGSYALNLSDQYWVHKSDADIIWNDINFFVNDFKEVVNFDFSGVYENIKDIVIAPDLTVDGSLRKKWIINENERYLIKGSRYDEMQEPFNEYIASNLMDLSGIEHVEYGLIRNKSNNIPLSICKCMADKNTDFITAQTVLDMELKENRNEYDRFIQICKKYEINDAKDRIDEMIILDYLIGNTDRHTGNFGIIRNADNLEWIKIVPIFDNGNSFCHNINYIDDINKNINSLCMWMGGGNYEKLNLIDYPQWYSKEKGNEFIDIVKNGLDKNEKITEKKKENLNDIFSIRIKELEKILNKVRL